MLGPFWFVVIVLVPAMMIAWRTVRRWEASGRWSRGGARALRVVILGIVAGFLVLPVGGAAIEGIAIEGVGGWAEAALTAGGVATIVIVTRSLLGDPSRGRRRCPRCWYDMSATTPGLVCPECGKDARRERRLFKTRRSVRGVVLGVLPLVVGMGIYVGWLWRAGAIVNEAPTAALIAASPWFDMSRHARAASELDSRLTGGDMRGWERAFAGRTSHRAIEVGGDEAFVLFHAQVLVRLHALDDAADAALIAITRGTDGGAARRAAELLSMASTSETGERAL